MRRFQLITQEGGTTRAIATLGNHVIYGLGMRVAVADVTAPDTPRMVGRSVPLGGIVNAIAVDGERIWVATSDGTLFLLALGGGQVPAVVAELKLPGEGLALAARDGWVFVAAGLAGLVAVDGRDAGRVVVADTLASEEVTNKFGYSDEQDLDLTRNVAWFRDGNARGARGALYAVDISKPGDLTRIMQWPEAPLHLVAAGPDQILTTDSASVELLDVRDPLSPRVIGAVGLHETRIQEIGVQGRRALILTYGWSDFLGTIDFDDMSPPGEITDMDPTRPPFVEVVGGAMTVAGRNIFIANSTGGFGVVDSAEGVLKNRSFLGDDFGTTRAVTLAGRWAYVAARAGLTAFDIADPNHPQKHGFVPLPQWYPDLSVHRAGGTQLQQSPAQQDPSLVTAESRDPATAGEYWVVATGIVSDAMIGELSHVSVADPENLEIVDRMRADSHAIAGDYAYVTGHLGSVSPGLPTRIVDLSNPGALRVVDGPALPYLMQSVEGNRGFAVAPDAPNVVATLDLSQPDRPQSLGSHKFDDAVQAVAAGGERVYVLTRGGHARLHVLRGVESGLLTETGSVVVDPLASRVLAMGLDVIVTYQQSNIHAPARWGIQLVAVDAVDHPRIADMIQLPDLIGVPAADPPYLYVPAEAAGFVVLRVD